MNCYQGFYCKIHFKLVLTNLLHNQLKLELTNQGKLSHFQHQHHLSHTPVAIIDEKQLGIIGPFATALVLAIMDLFSCGHS